MNKRWTEQKYVIYFLLSVMVLGVCGGVSYGVSCCQTGEFRSEEGIAWTAGEADKRYVPYTASEQRVIGMELLAFEEGHDGGGMLRSDGNAGIEAGTTDNPAVQAEKGEQTERGIGTSGQSGADTEAQPQANADTGASEQAGADTEAQPQANADTGTSEQSGADTEVQPQANADTGASEQSGANTEVQPQANAGTGASEQSGADTEVQPQANADTGTQEPAEECTETALELEDGADVQTGGWGIIVSAEDYEALLRIVQAEAGNEDTKGKILVANVVLNRVLDERFPNSVYDVVFQRSGGKAQFSPVASGSYYKVVVTEDTREAVNRALAGEDYSEGALFFAARRYAGSSQMRWFDECLTKLFSYGGHEFFTS